MSNPFNGLAESLGLQPDEIDQITRYKAKEQMQKELEQMKEYAKQATAEQQQQAYNQLTATTTLGSVGNWGTPIPSAPYPTHIGVDSVQNHEIAHLMVVTLVTVVGPSVAKKLAKKLRIRVTPDEIDKVYQEVKAILEDDHDEDLSKVIDECAKEMKI
jgi:hypothetical protein